MKRELKIKSYIRYADDFVILSESRNYLEKLIPSISFFLSKLKLTLHDKKLIIKTNSSGVDFLGWVHFSHHRVLRTSTKRRMFKNIKSDKFKIEGLTSYTGMLQHGNAYFLSNELKYIIISKAPPIRKESKGLRDEGG